MTKQFKILVVEDSRFFNELLLHQLELHIGDIAYNNNCTLNIDSFQRADDCLFNMGEDTDVAVLDYYLEDGKTALDIIKPLKKKNSNCRVVVLSHAQAAQSAIALLGSLSINFIPKDKNALSKICFIAKKLMQNKFGSIN